MKHQLIDLIDAALVEDEAAQPPFRSHLGGSMIGRPCEREIWYGFRWAKRSSFQGRMLRLFNRGHREEERFVGYLKRIGINVREFDEQGRQWRILDVDGHFGGSLDGLATNVPGLDPDEEILLEFKTHNTKSFCGLVGDTVRVNKPVHWAQMQIYMHKRGLKLALYMAVNKNDDDLYCEWVPYDQPEAEKLLAKAKRIIEAKQPPNRIGSNPSWYECKWCDYKDICHMAEPMLKNCRTCQSSTPVEDGKWHCNRWNAIIPSDAMLAGCDNYEQIHD